MPDDTRPLPRLNTFYFQIWHWPPKPKLHCPPLRWDQLPSAPEWSQSLQSWWSSHWSQRLLRRRHNPMLAPPTLADRSFAELRDWPPRFFPDYFRAPLLNGLT